MRTASASLLLLAVPVGAQLTTGEHGGPIEHFRLDLATGELSPADAAPAGRTTRASVPAAYDNASCVNGRFMMLPADEEWMDFGFKATGLSGVITEFTFAYATTAIDASVGGFGASIGLNVYTGTTGFCGSGSPGTLVASHAFTGLPGAMIPGTTRAVALSVDVSSSIFCVPDGQLGFSVFENGNPDSTGPMLVNVGGCPSGTLDWIDVYESPAAPVTCQGTISLPTPGTASFWFSMSEEGNSTPATATFRNTDNPADYVVNSPAKLGGSFDATITLDPLGLPISIVALGYSPFTVENPFGEGDWLVAPTPLPFLDLAVGTGRHLLPIPKDASLIGVVLYSQGFRASVGLAGLPTLDALNGYDLVVGT